MWNEGGGGGGRSNTDFDSVEPDVDVGVREAIQVHGGQIVSTVHKHTSHSTH